MDNTILRYNSVGISYNGRTIVHDVNVSLQAGSILGIVGESGSGKSTILKAAMGLLGTGWMVTGGGIWLGGKNLLELNEKQLRKIRGAEIGIVFQDAGAYLCPIRTIGSQIHESMAAHVKISKADARARALELFEKLNFKDAERVWTSYPFELSGGMNQRVGIAIAMLLNPSVLLADEPTSALDVLVQKQVILEMLRLRDLFGLSIILVTHDIGTAARMADHIMVLRNGEVIEYGRAYQILNDPQNEYTKALLSAAPKLKVGLCPNPPGALPLDPTAF